MAITDLIDAVTIPAFEHRGRFRGAKVSTKLAGEPGCSFTGHEIMERMNGDMLSLAEHVSLVDLAIDSIKGKVTVDERAIKGAMEIFYSHVNLALTAANPGEEHQWIFGEWTYDALDFRGAKADDKYISVRWIKRPTLTKKGYEGEAIETRLPLYEGVVKKTNDGYFDPRTGAPFEVDKDCKYDDRFLMALGKKVVSLATNRSVEEVTDKEIFMSPKLISPLVGEALKHVSLRDIDMREYIDLWRPSYAFSHNFTGKHLPFDDTMVVMKGIDEHYTTFTVSLGTDSQNCGIHVRSVRF